MESDSLTPEDTPIVNDWYYECCYFGNICGVGAGLYGVGNGFCNDVGTGFYDNVGYDAGSGYE